VKEKTLVLARYVYFGRYSREWFSAYLKPFFIFSVMQQLLIIGNIGTTAVVRQAPNGQAIGFSIAVNETYKDKEGKKQEKTTWYDATFWKALGASTKVADYLVKGQTVVVTGTPYADAYMKDGQAVAKQCVRVQRLELVGSVKGQGGEGQGAAQSNVHTSDDDNDLPF
jgi:single-strand DNA-binding protein